MLDPLWLVLLGVGTGFLGGALGLGGGFILVPVFHIVFKWSLIESVAASQFCILATSLSSAQRYLTGGNVNVRLGVVLESTTIAGAALGATIAHAVPELAILVIFAAITTVAGIRMWTPSLVDTEDNPAPPSRNRLAIGAGASGIVGVAAGLLGIGGGVLKVPILHFFLGEPMRRATATSAYMIGLTAAASAAVYYGRGDLDLTKGGIVALGILLGSHLGAASQAHIPVKVMKRVFSIILLVLAIRMVGKALGW